MLLGTNPGNIRPEFLDIGNIPFGTHLDDISNLGDLGFVNFGKRFLTFSMPELLDRMKLTLDRESRKRVGSDLSLTDSQEELNRDLGGHILEPGHKLLERIFKIRDKLVANEQIFQTNLKKRFGKRKRTVSFADDKGLPLETVKFVEKSSTDTDKESALEDKLKISPWIMAFFQPIFEKKKLKKTFLEKGVALETLDVEDKKMIGTIKVTNTSSPKKVFIRYTKDSWKTYTDVEAEPIPVDTDLSRVKYNEAVYGFELDLPDYVLHVQFAVCKSDSTGHHWDNSDGKNFILLHNSCLVDPSSESDPDSDSDQTKL